MPIAIGNTIAVSHSMDQAIGQAWVQPRDPKSGRSMLKDVVSWLDYSVFDEIALVLFAICFLAIVIRALMLKRETTDRLGSIPLTDDVVDPRPNQPRKPNAIGREKE